MDLLSVTIEQTCTPSPEDGTAYDVRNACSPKHAVSLRLLRSTSRQKAPVVTVAVPPPVTAFRSCDRVRVAAPFRILSGEGRKQKRSTCVHSSDRGRKKGRER